MACPHDEKRFCPLMHAAHEGWGLGCDDGRLNMAGGCAVDRGKLDYTKATAELRAQRPGYVEQIEFAADVQASQDQRCRNMLH